MSKKHIMASITNPPKRRAYLSPRLFAAIGVMLIVGILAVLFSHAATPAQSFEAELGTVAGSTKITAADTSASSSSYATLNNPTEPATGQFRFEGGGIIDPYGTPFLPKGLNMTGAHSYVWSQDFNAHGSSDYWATTWKFNTIRLVYCETCSNHPPGSQTYGTLDDLVAEYTAKKMVIIVDYHEGDFCGAKTAAERSFSQTFFAGLAAKYKNNPYVWFETFNEPMVDDQVAQWLQLQEPVVQAIRATGNTNIIVLSEPSCGQARDANNINNRFDKNDSGGIVHGEYLNQTYGNVMIDAHIYGRWGYGTTDDDLRAYFHELQSRNIPVLVGETGSYFPGSDPDSGQHSVGAKRLYRLNYPGVGILPWMAGEFRTTGGSDTDVSAMHWLWSQNPPAALPVGQ